MRIRFKCSAIVLTIVLSMIVFSDGFGQEQHFSTFQETVQAKLDSMYTVGLFPGATLGIVLEDGAALDLAKWAKLLYEGKVFSEAMLQEMLKVVDFRTGEPSEAGYGLGVMVFKTPFGFMYGHSGVFPGYQTQMSYFPEWEIAVAMQVNADMFSGRLKGDPGRFIGQLLPILKKFYGGEKKTK